LKVVFTSPQVFLSSLQSPTSPLSDVIREIGVKRAVIDSVSHFHTLTRSPAELRARYSYLINGLRREGITSLLLSEHSGPDLVRSDRGRLAYLVDSVILLRYVEIDSVMQRAVAVLKTRGSDHDRPSAALRSSRAEWSWARRSRAGGGCSAACPAGPADRRDRACLVF